MANEHNEQEPVEDLNNAVPRQQGTESTLDYSKPPVPNSEIGSVDSTAFANAKVITLKEAQLVLDNFIQTSQARGMQVNDEVHRVRDYCENFAPRREDAAELLVRTMVANKVNNPYHWAMIMNLSPETMDEFVHLLPELDPRGEGADGPFENDEQITALVHDMEEYRVGEA